MCALRRSEHAIDVEAQTLRESYKGLRTELAAMTEQWVAASTHLQGVSWDLESVWGASEVLWAHLFMVVVPEGPLAE